MLLLIVILSVGVVALSYLNSDNSSVIMNTYCNDECTERKLKKYGICC